MKQKFDASFEFDGKELEFSAICNLENDQESVWIETVEILTVWGENGEKMAITEKLREAVEKECKDDESTVISDFFNSKEYLYARY